MAAFLLLSGRADDTAFADDTSFPSDLTNEVHRSLTSVEHNRPDEEMVHESRADVEDKTRPATAPALPEGPSFFVRQIRIENNRIFSDKALRPYARKFENRTLVFKDLEKLTSLITSHYRSRGYVTSFAYVPPQTISDQTVVIRVVEAKIGRVSVEENRWFSEQVYRDQLSVTEGDVLNLRRLEFDLSEINREPDRAAKVYLAPGDTPGVSNLILKAEDRDPRHVSYEFNRRGSNLTHFSRHAMHVSHNNLTGHGDAVQSSLTMAEDAAVISGGMTYTYPLRRTGTKFHLDASGGHSELQKHLKSSDVTGKSFSLSPGVTQNFIHTPSFALDGFLGLEVKDSKVLVGEDKISYDRMRVLRAGPRMTFSDSFGRTIFSTDAHLGLPGLFGGSRRDDPSTSRLDSAGNFAYLTANVVRLQRLPGKAFLIAQGGGQWSPDPLTSLEQFRLGGMYSVRGYPENDASGDGGMNASAELRIPPYFLPEEWKVPGDKKSWREAISLAGFFDGGTVYNIHTPSAFNETRTLLGTGVGLRLYLREDVMFHIDLGFPLSDTSSEQDRPQVHLSARAGF